MKSKLDEDNLENTTLDEGEENTTMFEEEDHECNTKRRSWQWPNKVWNDQC